MIEEIGGRKFFFAFLVTILSFILVVLGKVSVEAWFTFISVVGATYVIGNSVESITRTLNK